MLPKLTFVLGGASSGKSAFAESLVHTAGSKAVYIATAQAFDDEMSAKISAHRARRGSMWQTVEAPLDLAGVLTRAPEDQPVLIDCLTLWLTNLMVAERDLETEYAELFSALSDCSSPVVAVSNEVGQGIVPEHAMSRRFRDAQGRLNQQMAARADLVVHVVAGLPNVLKGAFPDD